MYNEAVEGISNESFTNMEADPHCVRTFDSKRYAYISKQLNHPREHDKSNIGYLLVQTTITVDIKCFSWRTNVQVGTGFEYR